MHQSTARKRGATPGRDRDRDATQRVKRTTSSSESLEVVCRIKPYSGTNPCLAIVDERNVACIPPDGFFRRDGSQNSEKVYEFAAVFDEAERQETIFDMCAFDLIGHLVAGKSSLLFTYGVTGSGKTHTMTGKPTVLGVGVLPRTLDVLFNSIDNQTPKCVFVPNSRNGFDVRTSLEAHISRKKLEMEKMQSSTEVSPRYKESKVADGYRDDYTCSVFVSYVEIYNNICYDLLENSSAMSKRDVRMDAANNMYVEGVTEVEVEDSDEALEIFCRGEERRRVSDTVLNKESSRSHSIFTIRLVMAPFENDKSDYPSRDASKIIVANLSLVDLAGSERAKRTNNVGDRLAEAGSINKSLMSLRQCFEKLRRNQRYRLQEPVPYRDTKLTMLFKNYFEGSGKVRMIICANPRPDDYEENLNVLSFAEESQSVRVDREEDRRETDNGLRPPVPRRFYTRWNLEVDEAVKTLRIDGDFATANPPPFTVQSFDDGTTVDSLRNYYSTRSERRKREEERLENNMHEFEPLLRNTLCVADYAREECDELRAQLERESSRYAQMCAENKQLKRQIQSLRVRLSHYEAEDEEAVNAEQRLRRSQKEDRSRLKKQEETLKAIQGICDGAASPSFAALRHKFASQASIPTPTRKVYGATSSQAVATTATSNGDRGMNKENGPGFYNPKYNRRSRSANPRVLDHQPINRVPTGAVMRVKVPPGSKHVTKPEHMSRTATTSRSANTSQPRGRHALMQTTTDDSDVVSSVESLI